MAFEAILPYLPSILSALGIGGSALFGGKQSDRVQQLPTMTGEQQSALRNALSQFASGGGTGGALQHYQDLLSNDPSKMAAFEAPAMRQFNERIVPGLAERFSAVGGQRSSAFPQALSQAGADLSERLSAQRAQLQGQAAQGILGYLNQLLGQKSFENIYQQGGPSFLGALAPGIGQGLGAGLTSSLLK